MNGNIIWPNIFFEDRTSVFFRRKSPNYLGSLLTNENYSYEEIKCRLKAGNSVQKLLSSRFFSKNLKIKIYKTMLYDCETLSLALKEEFRLRVFKNRILRRIFGPRGMRMGSEEDFAMRNLRVCTVHLI